MIWCRLSLSFPESMHRASSKAVVLKYKKQSLWHLKPENTRTSLNEFIYKDLSWIDDNNLFFLFQWDVDAYNKKSRTLMTKNSSEVPNIWKTPSGNLIANSVLGFYPRDYKTNDMRPKIYLRFSKPSSAAISVYKTSC